MSCLTIIFGTSPHPYCPEQASLARKDLCYTPVAPTLTCVVIITVTVTVTVLLSCRTAAKLYCMAPPQLVHWHSLWTASQHRYGHSSEGQGQVAVSSACRPSHPSRAVTGKPWLWCTQSRAVADCGAARVQWAACPYWCCCCKQGLRGSGWTLPSDQVGSLCSAPVDCIVIACLPKLVRSAALYIEALMHEHLSAALYIIS